MELKKLKEIKIPEVCATENEHNIKYGTFRNQIELKNIQTALIIYKIFKAMLHHHDVIRMTLYHKSLCQRYNLILAIMIGITRKGNNSLVQLIIRLILSVL